MVVVVNSLVGKDYEHRAIVSQMSGSAVQCDSLLAIGGVSSMMMVMRGHDDGDIDFFYYHTYIVRHARVDWGGKKHRRQLFEKR